MIEHERPRMETRWPVLRVEPGHDAEIFLLAGQWVCLATHYHKRTQICLGRDDCPVCAFLPSRCYYYLPAAYLESRRPVLLEMSPMAASDLEQTSKLLEQGIRAGLVLRVTRRSCRAPLRFECVTQGPAPAVIHESDWVTAVMAIYGFGAMKPGESLADYRERMKPAALARCERLAGELRGASKKSPRGV